MPPRRVFTFYKKMPKVSQALQSGGGTAPRSEAREAKPACAGAPKGSVHDGNDSGRYPGSSRAGAVRSRPSADDAVDPGGEPADLILVCDPAALVDGARGARTIFPQRSKSRRHRIFSRALR